MLFHAIVGWWMLPAALTLLAWALFKVMKYLPHSMILLALGVGSAILAVSSWVIYAWAKGYLFWWHWVF